ncbi:MAG: amidohydrolase family protein, partial [Acidobacteriota bacterium]|nr:amidohydrolase family protein [Acidobacteriota bacterium]
YGITSIEDVAEPWAVPIYARLEEEGVLTARVSVWLPLDTAEEEAAALRARHPDDAPFLAVATRKVFLDGTLGARTAALHEDYEDAREERGVLRFDDGELVQSVRDADARGWAVAFHAIGDRAVRQALDVISALESRNRPRPHRIEHAQLIAPGDLPRFARLGVTASLQPVHRETDLRWLERRLGRRRAARAYPLRSLIGSGANVALGSDWPVESADPIRGLAAAAGRTEGEAITVAEAIDAYTRGSARAAGDRGERGTLRPGAPADLAVLSEDPTGVPVDELTDRVRVVRTVVGGRTVYREGEV